MTAPVLGKYSFYDGLEWKVFYPRTRYDQVVIDATTRFLRPATHTVNGKSFYSNNADAGIVLYPSDIPMSNESGAQTLAQFLTNFPTASNMVTAGNALTSGKIIIGSGNKGVEVSPYSVSDVIAIANGQSKSKVVSYADADSAEFNSNNNDIVVEFTDAIREYGASSSVTYSSLNLNIGDIIWVKEIDVPDRWVSAIDTTNNQITLSKLETSKVDLTNYATWGTTLVHYGITDALDLSSAQTITGNKIFSDGMLRFYKLGSYPFNESEFTKDYAMFRYRQTAHDIYDILIKDGKFILRYNYGIQGGTTKEISLPYNKEGTMALTSDIPTIFLKSVSVSGNTMTITKSDDTTVDFSGTKVFYGATTPSNPSTGDLWLDTSE